MGPPSLKSFEVASSSLSIIILSKDRLRFTIAFSGFEEKIDSRNTSSANPENHGLGFTHVIQKLKTGPLSTGECKN